MTNEYLKWLQWRTAELAIGRSTLRNQGAPGVVAAARKYLRELNLADFRIRSRSEFTAVLDKHTGKLKSKLPQRARNWGTARKALNIFLRDALYNRYLCAHHELRRLEPWLEVPLDRYVAMGLIGENESRTVLPSWRSIKSLTPQVSSAFQRVAANVAAKAHVARVHLDIKYWRGDKLGILG